MVQYGYISFETSAGIEIIFDYKPLFTSVFCGERKYCDGVEIII